MEEVNKKLWEHTLLLLVWVNLWLKERCKCNDNIRLNRNEMTNSVCIDPTVICLISLEHPRSDSKRRPYKLL